MIDRPARVDMRWRNPWRVARLRLLGWKVRFMVSQIDRPARGGARSGRQAEACRPNGRGPPGRTAIRLAAGPGDVARALAADGATPVENGPQGRRRGSTGACGY